jgi:hypothetical protein
MEKNKNQDSYFINDLKKKKKKVNKLCKIYK